MTTPEIDLAPSKAHRLPRRGAVRRAWMVVALGAVLTLLAAGALEYASRAHLREALRVPLAQVATDAVRDLNTTMSVAEFNPRGSADSLTQVAERHPESIVAPFALWMAHIHTIGQNEAERARLALQAANAAAPDNPRYAIYVDTAAFALRRAGRLGEAVALVEEALATAPPEHLERLQRARERLVGDSANGD